MPDTPPVLSFTSARRERTVAAESIDIDGATYTVRRPKDATILKAARSAGGGLDIPEIAALLFEFLAATFDQDSQRRLMNRIDDPTDGFDLDDLMRLVGQLAEHWGFDASDLNQTAATVAGTGGAVGKPRAAAKRTGTTGTKVAKAAAG